MGVPGDSQCSVKKLPVFFLNRFTVYIPVASTKNISASEDLKKYWRDNPDLGATCADLGLAQTCPYRIYYGDGADSHRNQNFEAMTLLPLIVDRIPPWTPDYC